LGVSKFGQVGSLDAVHIYPNRFVRNLSDLDDAELDGFAQMYLDILGRFDRLYPTQLPYMSALHQYTDTDAQRETSPSS
jgi:UDPglucose--hexose-1-phosphate uridylyltransferase